MNYLRVRSKLPWKSFKLLSNNLRTFCFYSEANFNTIFKQDFGQCLNKTALKFNNIESKVAQHTLDKLKKRIDPFKYENRLNIERIRYVYIHNFLYELFKPEIEEGMFKLDGYFTVNLTTLPNYPKHLDEAVTTGIPDHALINKIEDKPILIVEDKSGEISVEKAAIQCCFYTAAYASNNKLPYYYGVGSTLEDFIFIKYDLREPHIKLSKVYRICSVSKDNIEFHVRELELVANILRFIAIEKTKGI